MILKQDLERYKDQFAAVGYVHLKDVLAAEFVAYLKDFHARTVSGAGDEYRPGRVKGKKQQFLFEFPSDAAALEFRDGIHRLTGLDRDRITISERHLKQYDLDAAEFPAPHKDRGASKVSIGLPIHLGPRTRVCVLPHLDRTENAGETATFMAMNDPAGLSRLYHAPDAVRFEETVGDVIVFLGSSLYHERIRPAGTAVLYIKLNDDGRDPLGEDIFQRKRSFGRRAELALAG